MAAIRRAGRDVRRGHPYDPAKQHGFIDSQKYGMEVFRDIPPHCAAGRRRSRLAIQPSRAARACTRIRVRSSPSPTGAASGPAWSACSISTDRSPRPAFVTTRSGASISPTSFFFSGLRPLADGRADRSRHLPRSSAAEISSCPTEPRPSRATSPTDLQRNKAILGVFDEGCMGMYNAIIPDELLHPTGVFKERLSQSALVCRDAAHLRSTKPSRVRHWLDENGMRFITGPNPETDLTDAQILEQCKMYIAALRIADEFGCDAIGIQYQQGLKDLAPASDLAEGLLNNVDRPPVYSRDGRELYAGRALPHFNEVDECAGLDALITNRIWTKLGFDPETTLHDVRYGEEYNGEFVWVFEISGAAPPQHFIGGYAGTVSERQPPMYFRLGGGTVKGISKPGEIVWSRIFVEDGELESRSRPRRACASCPAKRPSAAGASPLRSGPSCTPSPTASRAIR